MEDRAKFIGYQECPGHAPLALYNVADKAHRLYGSTVSAHTLAKEGIPVPATPEYSDPDELAMAGLKTKTNPANKSYKGDTDVKAIGNIPAPGPGMMMVVNPAGPKDNQLYEACREMLAFEFESFSTSPKQYIDSMGWQISKYPGIEKMADQIAFTTKDINDMVALAKNRKVKLTPIIDFCENSALNDFAVNIVANKIHEYYKTKKNPALLILNPRTAVKAYTAKGGYTVIIGQSVYEMSHNANSPQGVNQYAGELKDLPGAKQGRPVPVKSLPLAVQQAITARMGKENPSKLQRWHDKLDRHYQTMVRLAVHMGLKDINGKKLSSALLKLENQAHKATTDYANGDIQMEDMDRIDDEVTAKVTKLFGKKLPGFFVNRDPRGYALKIDDKFMPKYEKVGLERDMGGYGILSPEISKDNPSMAEIISFGKKMGARGLELTKKYGKKTIAYAGPKLKEFGKKISEEIEKQTEQSHPELFKVMVNGIEKYRGTEKAVHIWAYNNYPQTYGDDLEAGKIKIQKIFGETKTNPMVKDMLTYRQKQEIKADLKRMAQMPQRRQHPEFATLELAAEYVDKALGKVITIIQGKDSYIIRHAKGIAAFSTTKNNKLIML